MQLFPSFDPQATNGGVIHTNGVNTKEQIMVYNDSPVGIKFLFRDNSIDVIPAYWNKDFIIDMAMGDVQWTIYYTLSNPTQYPISIVYGAIYEKEEHKPSANAAINRGVVVTGGKVTSTSTSAIANDGNASGSPFIESTLLGQTLSSVNMTNDGATSIKMLIGATLIEVLKIATIDPVLALGALTHVVEIIGDLKVNGLLTATANVASVISTTNKLNGGAANLPSGLLSQTNIGDIIDASSSVDTYYKARSTAGHLQQDVNGDIMTWDGNGIHLKRGAVNLLAGSITRMTGGHVSSISGVTVTHGLGTTPIVVLVCVDIAQAGSGTIGAGNNGATTFQCTGGAGAGLWWQAWKN